MEITKKRPTVWVLKEQMRSSESGSKVMDYTPAMQYGDLEFVTHFDMPLHTGSVSPKKSQWEVAVNDFCSKYDDTRDYIICTGQPSAIFVIGYHLATWLKAPRFLVWRREQSCYVLVEGGLDKAARELALSHSLGIQVGAVQ